jgi:hypothetical protein
MQRRAYIDVKQLWLLTAVLLFASALRIAHIVDFSEWLDEIWTIWHAQDSLADVFARTTTDWPPTFGVLTWTWMQIAGRHLEVFRLLSVLFSILGLAFVYRMIRGFLRVGCTGVKLSQQIAASVLSTMVYATLGFTIFSGVDARPYALLLALGPFATWVILLWLQESSLRNSMLVVAAVSSLLYIGFTALPFVAFLTLFVAILKPRLILNWLAIGIAVFAITLPLAPQFFSNSGPRLDTMPQPVPSFQIAMDKISLEFGGSRAIQVLLLVSGVCLILQAGRFPSERRKTVLAVFWILIPAVVYFVLGNNEFMKPRYIWWVALGLALCIGYAALRMPSLIQWAAIALLALIAFVPIDFNMYRLAVTSSPPYRQVLSWFAQHLRPGDVLVIDPNCQCGDRPYGWDYFVPLYFPTGYLPIVSHPGNVSRVWYLSTDGWPRDEELFGAIQKGRKASDYVGPWNFLLRLYEGPPSWEGVSFGGKVRIHGAEILRTGNIVADNEAFEVKLWWSANELMGRDYSISLAVLDAEGRLVAQADGPPRAPDTPEQTSMWQLETYYEDFRTIQLTRGLDEGVYSLVVTVYQWWDNVRLLPEANTIWDRVGEYNSYLELDRITILNID